MFLVAEVYYAVKFVCDGGTRWIGRAGDLMDGYVLFAGFLLVLYVALGLFTPKGSRARRADVRVTLFLLIAILIYVRLTGTGAQLCLYTLAASTGPSGVSVYSQSPTSWTERGGLTWNNQPTRGVFLSQVKTYANGVFVWFNVTPGVTGSGPVSFQLQTADPVWYGFDSRDAGTTLAPQLRLSRTPLSPPDPAKWTLRLSDDFNIGTDLNSTVWKKYGEDSDWPGHAGNGLRVARAVSVQNGAAVITAKEVNNVIESGAFMPRSLSATYGRYEARLRVDPDPSGVMSGVALTWPDSNNSRTGGELDWWETGTQRLDFKTFVHHHCGQQEFFIHQRDPKQWHHVAMEWEPSRLAIFVDGVQEGLWTDPGVIPHVLHHAVFQYDAFAQDMGSTVTKMYVDDVKIWTRN